jgi:hypothetical protein
VDSEGFDYLRLVTEIFPDNVWEMFRRSCLSADFSFEESFLCGSEYCVRESEFLV